MRGVDPLTASVLDSAAEGALLLDADHRVVHANDIAARLLKRDRATLEGELVDFAVAPRAWSGGWRLLDGAWPDGGDDLEAAASQVGVEPPRTVVWLRRRSDGPAQLTTLVEDLEALTGVGRWIWRPGEERLEWSAELHRIYGTSPETHVPSIPHALGLIHPLDRERATDVVGVLGREGRLEPLRFRIVRADGEVRTLVATKLVAEHAADGGPLSIEGWMQDITVAAGEQRLRLVARGARRTLERWQSTDDAPALLAAVGEALEAAFCVLWLPHEAVLQAAVTWSAPAFDGTAFEAAVRRARVAAGTGYAGRAWATGEPVTADEVPAGERTRTSGAAVAAGLEGGCAIPARTDHHVAAVLTVHTCAVQELSPEVMAGLARIGEELAHEVDRVRRARRQELSPREVDVLQAIAAGRATTEIAQDLGIRPATVRTHVEHILAKLGARDRAAAVATALRAGIIA